MTRRYPDQDTPAHLHARAASAARAASFKSASRQMSTAPWHEPPTTIHGPSETLIEEVCGGIAIAGIDRERHKGRAKSLNPYIATGNFSRGEELHE